MEEESTSPQPLRRSNRLRGKWRKAQIKGPQFIDLGGETPIKPLADRSPPHLQKNIETSPPDVDMSPSQPELEISSPQQDFGVSPRKTPEINPNKQEVYDYLEYLEKIAAGSSTSSTLPHTAQETQVQSLKQEVFELEVLNRHIK